MNATERLLKAINAHTVNGKVSINHIQCEIWAAWMDIKTEQVRKCTERGEKAHKIINKILYPEDKGLVSYCPICNEEAPENCGHCPHCGEGIDVIWVDPETDEEIPDVVAYYDEHEDNTYN